MKSLLSKIISMLTIAVLAVSLCACDTTAENGENCDSGHSFVDYSYTAPTCKTNGEKAQKCSRCGFVETETLLTIDHDYQEKTTTPSTCATNGSTIYECSMCHETFTNTLPLLNHDYKLINETPSTCSAKGVKEYKCNDCDDIYTEDLKLLNHNYNQVNTATCFSDGELKNVCSECQHEEVIETISMFTHEFGTDGYCTKCGIYETLIDVNDLNVTSKRYSTSAGTTGAMVSSPALTIRGNLTPKFKANGSIPYTYFETHQISLTTYLYDKDNQLLDSITTLSTINYYQGDSQYTMTLQYGGFTNGFANQFVLNYSPNYADIKVFSKETLNNAISFKIKLSCGGYNAIEKTYEITQAQ